MKKKYEYVIYEQTRSFIEDEWIFTIKEKSFKDKTTAIEYLIDKCEKQISMYNLDPDEIIIDQLAFVNLKTNTMTWLQTEEVL